MITNFKKRFRKVALLLGGLFVLLFLFRLSYGYWGARTVEGQAEGGSSDFFSSLQNLRKNYASEKIGNLNTAPAPGSFSSSQKYEKTATVQSKTLHFEEDEALIRKTAGTFNAPIQYEKGQGKKGNRELNLSIGVTPALFDSFYHAVQQIGELRSTTITKIDKTNEYRQLNAKQTSLEKTLASLNELKSKGGAISDFVSLHEKILEIETQIQELGVDLGNYNTENEFCTLQFSLYEGSPGVKMGLFHRVKIALEWTIHYYAVGMVGVAAVLMSAFFGLLVLDKLKIFSSIIAKVRE
ncbi:MAG TPA: DUF4349 domain-containing protein [Puia sp.]|nr:DUF4349 domain-containing protein [Puia sp.]